MKLYKKPLLLSLSLVLGVFQASAMQPNESPAQIRRAVLRNLVGNSQKYSIEHPTKRPNSQHPRATVVSCADSRCQTTEFDQTPEEDLFVVRNIGNQFASTKGSIWYGVKHLGTPLLLFIGHANCGAITAKLDGTEAAPEKEVPQYVKDELRTLYVDERDKNDLNLGIIKNVNRQVDEAVDEFNKEENGSLITNRKLTVMGAIYDFRDDFGRGVNSLIFINVNGNTNPVQLADIASDLKGSVNPIIGVGALEINKIENRFKLEKKVTRQ